MNDVFCLKPGQGFGTEFAVDLPDDQCQWVFFLMSKLLSSLFVDTNQLTFQFNASYRSLTRELSMYELKNESLQSSVTERWDALEDYFVCITECDLNDKNCITSCHVTHLNIDDGSASSAAA